MQKTNLLGLRVLDLFWGQKVPVRVQAACLLLHIVDEDAVSSIREEDESIYMGQLISLTWNILLD